MKKEENLVKKNTKLIIGIVLGVIITGGITIATYNYYATDVRYTENKNVAQALNELYEMSQLNEEIASLNERLQTLEQNTNQNEIQDTTPIGTVIAYLGTSAPENYIACDGSLKNKSEYEQLFNVLSTINSSVRSTWGSANWSTQFRVPNLQGEFLRGSGTNSHSNQGSGEVVGKHQDGTEHFRISSYRDNNTKGNLGIYTQISKAGLIGKVDSKVGNTSTKLWAENTFVKESTGETDSEYYTSRPTNTSVLYCIKAK